MDSSRVLLAVILSIILVVAYQELVLKRFFPPTQQQQAAEQHRPGEVDGDHLLDLGRIGQVVAAGRFQAGVVEQVGPSVVPNQE